MLCMCCYDWYRTVFKHTRNNDISYYNVNHVYTVGCAKFGRKALKETGHDTELTEQVIKVCMALYTSG